MFYQSPQIVIFTNVKIWQNRSLLTDGRWEIYTIYKKELYLYNEEGTLIKGEPIKYPIEENQKKLYEEMLEELIEYFKHIKETEDIVELDNDPLVL